jgi:hypothetical protein
MPRSSRRSPASPQITRRPRRDPAVAFASGYRQCIALDPCAIARLPVLDLDDTCASLEKRVGNRRRVLRTHRVRAMSFQPPNYRTGAMENPLKNCP